MILGAAKYTVEQHIPKKESPILCAVSGGVDSVVLLHVMHALGYTNCTVFHLNHKLREAAADDATFVEHLAKTYGYGFLGRAEDIEGLAASQGYSIEQAGRVARYRVMEDWATSTPGGIVLTAHHQDDQLETILMHKKRGAGLFGMAGMQTFCPKRRLLRPLLGLAKEEILRYATNHALSWREDESNMEKKFERNRVRINVLPSMSKGEKKRLLREAKEAREKLEELSHTCEHILGMDWIERRNWSRKHWSALSNELLAHALILLIRHIDPAFHYTKAHILTLQNAFQSVESGSIMQITGRKHLLINKTTIVLEDQEGAGTPSNQGVSNRTPDQEYQYQELKLPDLSSLPPLEKRNLMPGDRIIYFKDRIKLHQKPKKFISTLDIHPVERPYIEVLAAVNTKEVYALLYPVYASKLSIDFSPYLSANLEM